MTGKLLSALFLDFDNVYLSLDLLNPRASRAFATTPKDWMSAITHELDREDERERSFIVRRCYVNPQSFARFRPYFTRSGFEVIDCPSLTARGKNSADIYCVMDILDTLRDYPHVEEYLILSADADFTPVITRLRKHVKRTVIYASAATAAAYKSACDLMLDENAFTAILLGGARDLPPAEEPARPFLWERAALPAPREDPQPAIASEVDLERLARALAEEVSRSVVPVPFAAGANIARDILGPLSANWAGFGLFKDLLRGLPMPDVIVDEVQRVLRPNEVSAQEREARAMPAHGMAPDLAAFVRQLNAACDVPPLQPETYQAFFEALADEIRQNGYGIGRTPKAVAHRLAFSGAYRDVSVSAAGFITKGIAMRQHRYGPGDTPSQLAGIFRDQVAWLAERAGLALGDGEFDLLRRWIRGGPDGASADEVGPEGERPDPVPHFPAERLTPFSDGMG